MTTLRFTKYFLCIIAAALTWTSCVDDDDSLSAQMTLTVNGAEYRLSGAQYRPGDDLGNGIYEGRVYFNTAGVAIGPNGEIGGGGAVLEMLVTSGDSMVLTGGTYELAAPMPVSSVGQFAAVDSRVLIGDDIADNPVAILISGGRMEVEAHSGNSYNVEFIGTGFEFGASTTTPVDVALIYEGAVQ